MSYDAAMDQLAEWEEEKKMEEYYGKQWEEWNEENFVEEEKEYYLNFKETGTVQSDNYHDEYFEIETGINKSRRINFPKSETDFLEESEEQADMKYREQLRKYYDELELKDMIELEEKCMEAIVDDYYKQNSSENIEVDDK